MTFSDMVRQQWSEAVNREENYQPPILRSEEGSFRRDVEENIDTINYGDDRYFNEQFQE